jgi:hypothetical protein
VGKDEPVKRVAGLTGKPEKVVNFAFRVLKRPSHQSNKKRSMLLGESGQVKLSGIRKPSTE